MDAQRISRDHEMITSIFVFIVYVTPGLVFDYDFLVNRQCAFNKFVCLMVDRAQRSLFCYCRFHATCASRHKCVINAVHGILRNGSMRLVRSLLGTCHVYKELYE